MNPEEINPFILNLINGNGARRGIPVIKIGDRVRVKYSGNEDNFRDQLRKGTVYRISLTRLAEEYSNPEFLEYVILTNDGQTLKKLRLCLEKIE